MVGSVLLDTKNLVRNKNATVINKMPGTISDPLKIFLFWGGVYLFIYLWLCWVFVSVRGLSLVAARGGHSTIAASLVAEHRLQTRRLSNCGSRA